MRHGLRCGVLRFFATCKRSWCAASSTAEQDNTCASCFSSPVDCRVEVSQWVADRALTLLLSMRDVVSSLHRGRYEPPPQRSGGSTRQRVDIERLFLTRE